MSQDLFALLGVGLLAFVLQMLPGIALMPKAGLAWGVGNRDATPEPPPWGARAARAHKNLMENLPHFTMLVLVAELAHEADVVTGLACLVFLGARVAHAAVYIAGVTVIRTIAFYTGVAAELVIAYAILT